MAFFSIMASCISALVPQVHSMKQLLAITALVLATKLASAGPLKVTETETTIEIVRGEVPVLTYHKAEVAPPEGANPIYKRSGFIHPLCAPCGEPVTGIHPDDHYHHLGLWHAWVKTKHGEDKPDFWNLKTGTGRVRYSKTLGVYESSNEDPAVGFAVEQEQVAYKGAEKKETVVLRESLEVKVEYRDGANLVSYMLEQKNVSKESLILPAYRYGGCLAYRAPHHWDLTNSDYLTSEGLDRTNSHATRARWVAMFGPTEKGHATVSVLMHPRNRDFPQRIRTWPNQNNGAIFFNVVPIQEKSWEIKPGERIVEGYVISIADGKPDKDKIEAQWKSFAGEK